MIPSRAIFVASLSRWTCPTVTSQSGNESKCILDPYPCRLLQRSSFQNPDIPPGQVHGREGPTFDGPIGSTPVRVVSYVVIPNTTDGESGIAGPVPPCRLAMLMQAELSILSGYLM